jgi:putative ABC transport system permease protein
MWIAEWVRRLYYLLNRSRLERDLQQEMEAHRAMMREPARFGNTLRLGEASRDAWGWSWLDALQRDVRYGLRGLRREPTFAVAAILTLALGIATTTTVFSIADSELWKALPYPRPERLVAIYSRGPAANDLTDVISGADLMDWRSAAGAFSELAAVGRTSRVVIQLETAQVLTATDVTPNYFAALGRQAIAGAIPATGGESEARTAILTERAWKRLLNEDSSILGRPISANGELFVIRGVVTADESLGIAPDIYTLIDEKAPSFLDRRNSMFSNVIGRLADGTTPDIAVAQVRAAETRLQREGVSNRAGHAVTITDLRRYYSGNNWRPFYFFLGASAVVLLLSVINVATLLVSRSFRRTREFAIRGAVGGGRKALLRHLIVEGGLLAFSGAAIGLILSASAVKLFASELPSDFLLRGSDIPIDYRVFALVLTLATLITVAFALSPLLLLRKFDLSAALGAGARSAGSAREGRMRAVMLASQIGLTVVLLSGSAVFLKSFSVLTSIPLGFDPQNAIALRATLNGPRYAEDAAVRRYADQLLELARRYPNVRDAAVASSSPLGSGPVILFRDPETAASASDDARRGLMRVVGPEYFRTLGIRMLQGRDFSPADAFGAPRVAIVNESLARQVFGNAPAVGRRLELPPGGRVPWTRRPGTVQIVGVAANVKDVGVNEVEFANVYLPFAQAPSPSMELIVRANTLGQDFGRTLVQEAARLDPAMPVSPALSFQTRVSRALESDRFNAILISVFAAVALILAAVGIYGMVAYNVQARQRELGVRLALGAEPIRLFATALWRMGFLAIVGETIGLAGAVGIAIAIGDALYLVPGSHNGMLYGVRTTDPMMLGAAFLGVAVVVLLAAAIPARRISFVDPASTLRGD